MKLNCKSCEAIRRWNSDYTDPSILCPVCQASMRLHSAVPGRHMARRDDDDDERDDDDDRPRKKRPASDGSSGAGAAAGLGIGMIILIVGGLLTCCVCLPGVGGFFVWMGVKKAGQGLENLVMVENMRKVAMANHQHQTFKQHFASPKMQPLQPGNPAPELSWRVSILENDAFNGQAFNRFDRNLSWDNPKNKQAMNPMPQQYLNALKPPPDMMQTEIQYFTGPKTPFPDPLTKVKAIDFRNGTSNTFMCAQASSAVPWSKPADMVIGPGALPLPEGRFVAAMFDGSARIVNRANAADDVLRKIIDPKTNEQLPNNWGN